MNYIIDRFEGDFAICEDGEMKLHRIERSLLPKEADEGSVLLFENGEYTLDLEAQAARREEIIKLQNSLFDE